MDQHQLLNSNLFDLLFCEEERFEDEEEQEINNDFRKNPSLFLLEQDMFWEDEELVSLFAKERETYNVIINNLETHQLPFLESVRKEAVKWILRVISHYSFSPLTAILSVNYLDRFLSSHHFQREKPWMTQLVAVSCLTLAAKVEETQVPLLLDFQVEESKYIFEAKTIQRMELLILSTLQWKMNPVTPISFLDHIIRRLGFSNNLHWEFLRRCEHLLLLVVADSKFFHYLPSVLATAIMLHVIDEVEPENRMEYQNQLMTVLKLTKEDVEECYQFIMKWAFSCNGNKRKYGSSIPSSPNGVIDVSFSYGSDNSNESWAIAATPSVSSSPEHHLPLFKKSRAEDPQMRLPSFNRAVVIDVLSNSPL
ncbi:hypothetical protein C5167_016917 [Papaver somniferum]|uniref:Uncharacterized protein n=1 Tax=Papaver somniferum TaxID=3469 RepID=A0A4Y7IL84_PAPSO|nr:cyclin-D3-1-like [Papaver somniferum]RZC48492.1 hypothetical protein C5167_016917 [Papaver somniferum]